MSTLDGVLADLVEADRECAYVTIKREPLEALIDEWASRGDRVALLCGLLTRARRELAQAPNVQTLDRRPISDLGPTLRALDGAVTESASAIAHHRHTVRRELAARLKQVLRSAIAEVGTHATDALLSGNRELAERLESERQTVRIVMSTIDVVVDSLLKEELTAAGNSQDRGHHATPAA